MERENGKGEEMKIKIDVSYVMKNAMEIEATFLLGPLEGQGRGMEGFAKIWSCILFI